MKMRWQGVAGLLLGAAIVSGGVLGASAHSPNAAKSAHGDSLFASAQSSLSHVAAKLGIGDSQVAPGTIDDGKELLPKATITLDQAIKAAQAARSGDLGEVDLEDYHGTLVFNVDIGGGDVKVDAATGAVLGDSTD